MKPTCDIVPVRKGNLAEFLEDLLEVEALSFPHPWGAEVFAGELDDPLAFLDVVRQRQQRKAAPPGGLNRQRAGWVVAFCSYRQLYDEMHILQVATHPEARQEGHAARLMDHVVAVARQRGCKCLLLEVRPSNRAAVNLYEKFGFRVIGIRKAYYADNREDALVMQHELL